MAYNPNASKLIGLDPNYYNKQGQGYGTNQSNPLNPDGSPTWIGLGKDNPNRLTSSSGMSRASINPYDAIASQKQKALQTQRDAQNKLITDQSNVSRATLGGQSQASARNLAEYLAQRGLTSSGTAAQGEINRLGTLQQGLGALEQQKNTALLGVETQYQSGLATAQEEALQQAQAQEKERMASAIATIGAYGQDYMDEIKKRTALNPNDPLIPYLMAARNEKLKTMETTKSDKAQQDFENWAKREQLRISGINASNTGGSPTKPDYISDSILQGYITTTNNMGQTVVQPNAYQTVMDLYNAGSISYSQANSAIIGNGLKPTSIMYGQTPTPLGGSIEATAFKNLVNNLNQPK